MKKIITILLAVFTVASLCSVFASAEAYNPADGCTISVQIKKADPSNVIKDGVIGENEYEEIEIDRSEDNSCCLLSWHGGGEMYDKASAFLKNVHFYMSWDEVNGLNVAVKCRYEETPVQVNDKPADDRMSNNGEVFPGDEFIAQCGVMFDVVPGEDDTTGRDMILYRGIARRTDNGEYLVGHYGHTSQGYDYSAPKLVGGENLVIEYGADNWVTYEFSVPVSSVVANASAVGESFEFNLSAVGGSTGVCFTEGSKVYAVSIGDGGYMTSRNAASNPQCCYATFTDVALSGNDNGGNDDNGGNGGNGSGNNGNGGNDSGSGSVIGDGGNGGVDPVNGDNGGSGNSGYSTKTGDIAAVLAVVSVLSAGGIMLGKKRK